MVYDVAVIGAGIIGCGVARELSRYNCKAVLIEKENDVAMGTTRANSAIIHAGYDPEPGTLMAKYNAPGNKMAGEICEELDVPFKRCGSFVLAFSEEEMETVKKLYERGVANGVPDQKILTGEEVREMEPNVNENCVGALYAPSAGIVNPWEFALAMGEQAVENGVELKLCWEVASVKKEMTQKSNRLTNSRKCRILKRKKQKEIRHVPVMQHRKSCSPAENAVRQFFIPTADGGLRRYHHQPYLRESQSVQKYFLSAV